MILNELIAAMIDNTEVQVIKNNELRTGTIEYVGQHKSRLKLRPNYFTCVASNEEIKAAQ